MNKIFNVLPITLIYALLLPFATPVSADVVDLNGIRWPMPEWNIAPHSEERMANPRCQEFLNFATQSKKFKTESLVVIKDGTLQYEGYEEKYNAKTPHILWSVSKTITGALLGIAVRDGKIDIEQNLNEFYPRSDLREAYQKIKIKNLFYLDTGFIWDEYYVGDVRKNPVLTMLYGKGHKDITNYATSVDIIPQGPGYKWDYSTGTPAITMGVLKQVYGDEYDQMPWKVLFNPIGMTNVYFERDHKGVFSGGSSAYATPRDMARLGYLYLNNGNWNGQQIIPTEWIEKTKAVSPGYLSDGTVIRNITDVGVFGGSVWLNKSVKRTFGRPFPYSPENMYMALGHFGQMIVVLPTQNMVIARTGYDNTFNSKIDAFVSRAISCFADPNYPIGKIITLPKYSRNTFPEVFRTVKTSLYTSVIQAVVAKNVCSCHFISGLDIKTCIARSNIPAANLLTNVQVVKNSIFSEQTRVARFFGRIFGLQPEPIAEATFDLDHPEFGCTLK